MKRYLSVVAVATVLLVSAAPAAAMPPEPASPRCNLNGDNKPCDAPPGGCDIDQSCPEPTTGCDVDQTCPKPTFKLKVKRWSPGSY